MSYQVFARKYRPQTFDDVIGQEHITRTLKNAIAQNRLAHAYLFVGPRGIGKTSTARILAKAHCCVHAPTAEPCGVCDACKEIAAGISLDVLEIDGASNNGVEQVRELRENVRYLPTRGSYKVYIIDEVHMLTSAAFNALLKTLEEPPEHVKFIFATTEPQKVLPTILSRCQRFDLRRIPADLIAAHLQGIAGKEKIQLAPDAAAAIARGADGGLRDAESMLDQLVAFCGDSIALDDVLSVFGFSAPETIAGLADSVLRGDSANALAALDAQSDAGKDLQRLMGELIGHLRNLLVFQVNPAAEGSGTELERQAGAISPERLLELIDGFAIAEGRMKWAPNKKLHFEIALIKAVQTLGQSTLGDVLAALGSLRDGSPAAARIAPAPAATPTAPPVSTRNLDWAQAKKAIAPAPSEMPAPPPLPPSPEPVAPPPPIPSEEPVDGPRVWSELIGEIRSQRPLITAWVQSGSVLGVEGKSFRVGFSPDQKMIVDSLGKPNNRKFLEGLLTKLAGREMTLKLEMADNLPVAEPPAPPPTPAKQEDPVESFKNDPKIKQALQLFEGQIRSVEPAAGAI